MKNIAYEDQVISRTDKDGQYLFWCPGCGCSHVIETMAFGRIGNHTFNGDYFKPTFRLASGSPFSVVEKYNRWFCGFIITNGIIHYMGFCKHYLAGFCVEMRERKDWGGIIFTKNENGGFNYRIEP